ncbi:MAG: hypothetical protein OXE57_01345 [Alphaproteobacteria bacterium]|nr:hypothetical protein [Alphaproteobacteria bacterium]
MARFACLAVAVLLAWSSGGHAFTGSKLKCDPTDNDIHEASRVIGEVEEMERAVIRALRLQTGQLAGYQAQSTRAIVEALDAQTRFQAQIAREVEESEEVRARRPTRASCRLVTGATGLAGARAGEAEALRRAAMIESGRIAGDRRFFDPGGAAADSEARFSRLTGTWCNAGRSGQVACQGHEHLHGADVRADTLFDTATFHDAATLEAAVELARNLASPLVHDQPALASATTPAERRRVLLGRSADARAALAADVFSRARALRAPAVDLGAWAQAVLPEGGARKPGPLSRHELLEILASSRFDDPEWFLALQEESSTGLMRQIAGLLAINLMVDWERFRLEERQAALLAVLVAAEAEAMRRLDNLGSAQAGVN